MFQGISIHLLEQKMKRILAILTGALLLAACVNEQDPTVPVISIIEAPDEFTSEAQRGTITYSITDKHTGAEVSLAVDAVPSADWIYDVDASSPGSVVFSIGENDSENPRTASVSIAAPGAESVSVSVSQEGRSGSSAVQGFAIEVTDITAFEATIKVIPEDPEMTYLLLTGTKEEIDAYESDEELIQYNLDLFSSIAETYGYSLEMLLEDVLLRSGETVTTMDTFLPDTDYYIYVYGMGKDAVPVTAVFKEPLRTAPVPWFDEDIAITFPEVGTRNISAVFTPGSASFRYLAGNLTAAEYDTYGDDKIVPTMITEIQYVINMYAGLGIEKTWADFTYNGPIQIDSPNLYSGSEYVYYAFGVDNGYQTTPLSVERKKTLSVEVTDDCRFDMKLVEAGPYEATLSVSPSSDDTKYFITVFEDASVAGLSPEVIADACINGMQTEPGWVSSLFSGYREETFDGLVPNSGYTFVAFGVDEKGERTTDVGIFKFSTAEVPRSDMTFRVSVESADYSSITVNVSPSSQDETYVMGIITEAQYQSLGSDPDAVAEDACRNNTDHALYQNQGEVSQRIYYDYDYDFVRPGTVYYVFVFGCSYWNQTTDVTLVRCETPEREVSDASVRIDVTVYDGNDLVEFDPEKYPASTWSDIAALRIEFIPTSGTDHWYGWIEERSAEYMQGLNLDVLLGAIKANGSRFPGTSSGVSVLGVPWNYSNCAALALGVDADGKDGDPVIVSLEADRSQIAEFEPELFSGSSSASSVPLSSSFTAAERVREARGNAVIREYVPKRYLLAPEDVEAVTSGRSAAAGEIRSLKEIARETVAAMLESRGEALPEAAGI